MPYPRKVNIPETLRLRKLGYTLDEIAKRMNVTRQAIILTLAKNKGEIGVKL